MAVTNTSQIAGSTHDYLVRIDLTCLDPTDEADPLTVS
jgi:hypothetical protein